MLNFQGDRISNLPNQHKMVYQAVKIRICPSSEQKAILAQDFGSARWPIIDFLYNQDLALEKTTH